MTTKVSPALLSESYERSPYTRMFGYSFTSGFTITSSKQELLHEGSWYCWNGAIPTGGYIVPPNSTPLMAGGVGATLWAENTNQPVRDSLYETGGYKLLEGSGKQIAPMSHVTLSRMPNGGTWGDLIDAINNYESVEIDKNVARTSSITVPLTLKKLYGRGIINTNGEATFAFPRTVLATANVSAISDAGSDLNATFVDRFTKVTVDSIVGFQTGQAVKVVGSNSQTLWGRIQYITPAIIAIDSPLDFTVSATSCTIQAIDEYDCDIDVRLSGSGTTATNIQLSSCGVRLRVSSTGVANIVSVTGAYNSVHGKFRKSNYAVLGYDCGPNKINDIDIDGSKDGIRLVRAHLVEVSRWKVTNGSSKSYSTGVELTAESGSYDKNSRCTVEFGEARAVNFGVQGSGIGGIHLNFNAKHHTIHFNKSMFNSIGCYLENSSSNNNLYGNEFSKNHGYYGTGLQLDADCSYNRLTNNTCNDNGGATAAVESWGIELRNGPNKLIPEIDNLPHPCNYNQVLGNTALNNQTGAYKINGVGNVFDGNIAGGTSSSRFSGFGMLHSTDSKDLSIGNANNINASGSVCTYTCYIAGSEDTFIGASKFISSGSQTNTILVEHGSYTTSKIALNGTRLKSACSQRGLLIRGVSGTLLSRPRLTNVEIEHTENGYAPYELDYCDSYKIQDIELVGTATTARVIFNCTNQKGMSALQADSVAADVATLKTDFNALLAKLRSGGVMTTS